MRKLRHIFTTALLAITLLTWSSVGWGQEPIYTIGFESTDGFTAGSVYNNTTEAFTGPTGQQWGTYYGTPSTTGPITDLQSLQMRYYTTAPANYGYTFTNFDLANVSKVTFKAKNNANVATVTASYSTDGGVSYTGDQIFTLSTTAADYEYIISATSEYPSVRIKFTLTGTTVAERLTIDDIKVYGPDTEAPVPTFFPLNAATDVAVDVNPTITFDEAVRNTDGSEITDPASLIVLKETDASGAEVTFTATINAEKTQITIEPTSSLDFSQLYYVAVSPVEDAAGNEMTAASATFTTIAATLEVTFGVVNGNGTLAAEANATPITTGDLVDVGSEVVFTATPDAGYRVLEWKLNTVAVAENTTNTFTIADLQEASDVTVEFELIPPSYAVTFDVVGANGTIAATVDAVAITSTDEVEEGKDVVFTATPAEGFRVKEWKLNTVVVPDNTTTTLTISSIGEASTVTVEFEAIPEYLVTFTVIDGTDPVEGAIVTVAGTDLDATNASGVTTVELGDGVYAYTVYAAGLLQKTGEITVSGAVLNVPVALVAHITEEFDYPVGTQLVNVGYTAHSGAGANTITVTEASISYPSYASSGIGNEISLVPSGEDVSKLFDPQTKDEIYVGLLVNVTSTSLSGDYFFHLSSNPGGAFKGRLWVKEDAESKIAFGIAFGGTPVFTDFIYDKNTTYLVAMKYEFVDGADNDKVAIYINPALGETEPATGWLYNTDVPAELANIGYYAFRQGTAGNVVNVKLDGVRIAKTWEQVFVKTASSDATLSTLTLGGLNALTLTGVVVEDPATDDGAILFVDDFTDFVGIEAIATDASAATVEVKLNDVVVEAANYATQALDAEDVVVVSVEAEDGTMAYYKVTIQGDNRVLTLTSPTGAVSLNTGEDLVVTWTSSSIDNVNIYAVSATKAIDQINDDPIVASLGTYTTEIPNGVFGDYFIRVADATDATFYDETATAVTLVDNQAPAVVELTPASGAVDLFRNFTLSIEFDEDVAAGTGDLTIHKASDDAVVVTIAETDITVVDNMVTADVEGLAYETAYYVLIEAGMVEDLAGNGVAAVSDITTWTFTTLDEPAMDLFISEYLEGSSNNKALEIYNPMSQAVDLSAYVIKQANNGSGWGNVGGTPDTRYVLPLSGTLQPGEVLVLANAAADPIILAVADHTFAYDGTANGSDGSNVLAFNGDDAIGLFKNDVLIDLIGDPNNDPGTNWPVAGTGATSEYTLVRKGSVIMGNTDWAASAGTDANDSEWIVFPQNTFDYLGFHIAGLSTEANILTFTLDSQLEPAVIDATAATVDVEVLYGTNIASLTPSITISLGATIVPAGGSTLDFTNPVEYTVTAEDGSTKLWTVTVTEGPMSDKAEILTFVVDEAVGDVVINSVDATVDLVVAVGTDIAAITPSITISLGATIVPDGGTEQDFTNPVVYTVTAQDGTTTKDWTVTITVSQIINIYDIQYTDHPSGESPLKGEVVTTQGIVTAIHYNYEGGSFRGFFIQDGEGAWNGLYVYNQYLDAELIPEVGDEITITGLVEEWYGSPAGDFSVTELTSGGGTVDMIIEIVSSDNELPAPVVVTTAVAATEPYEGVLVKVENAEYTIEVDNYGVLGIDDGSGEVYLDDDMHAFELAFGSSYNVTGIGHFSYDLPKILPRFAEDIELVSSVTPMWGESIATYPNPFTSTIWIDNAENASRVVVVNLIGQQVMNVNLGGESRTSIQTDNLPSGVYLVTIVNNQGQRTVRKMIKQ